MAAMVHGSLFNLNLRKIVLTTAAIVKKTELKIVVIGKKIATTIVKMHGIVRTTVKTIAMTDKMADRIIVKIDVTEESKHLFTDFKNKKKTL